MRQFATADEIRADPRFAPSAPVSLESYRRLIGYYVLREDLRCCMLQPGGGLCNQQHRKGWVAELADGKISLIGHECATSTFGADSLIGRDIARAVIELDEEETRARLTNLLTERKARDDELEGMIRRLLDAQARITELHSVVGASLSRRLEDMARQQAGDIVLFGIIPAERDAAGDLITYERRVRIVVGRVPGLSAFPPYALAGALKSLREIRAAWRRPVRDDSRALAKAERDAVALLADHKRRLLRADELCAEAEHLLGADLRPLAFLTEDAAERLRLVREVSKLRGEPLSAGEARRWLARQEAALRHAHGVKRLQAAA